MPPDLVIFYVQADQRCHVFERLCWNRFEAILVEDYVFELVLELLESVGADVADAIAAEIEVN